MIRATITRRLADITPLDHDPAHPILIPAGWDYAVYNTGGWTLITGNAATQSDAIGCACHHINGISQQLRRFANQRPLPTATHE